MAKLTATMPPNVHPHTVIYYLREKYNLPPIFYLDTFPFSWPVCAIIDPEVAHQVTVQNPLPKHECIEKTIWPVVGHKSLVSIDGPEHKKWRAIFNPGFSSVHLMTLVDGIVDDAMVFLSVLSKYADSGEIFHLEDALTKLTVDVIGRVVLCGYSKPALSVFITDDSQRCTYARANFRKSLRPSVPLERSMGATCERL